MLYTISCLSVCGAGWPSAKRGDSMCRVFVNSAKNKIQLTCRGITDCSWTGIVQQVDWKTITKFPELMLRSGDAGVVQYQLEWVVGCDGKSTIR